MEAPRSPWIGADKLEALLRCWSVPCSLQPKAGECCALCLPQCLRQSAAAPECSAIEALTLIVGLQDRKYAQD